MPFLSPNQQCTSEHWREQEAQLMLTNLRDAFVGQSRSPNIVPFHMLCIVSYCAIVTLSFFTIFDFKKCRDLEMVSKVTQGHWVRTTFTPKYLSSLLSVPRSTGYSLRSTDRPLLTVPRTRTSTAGRRFSCAGPLVWNTLPDSVVHCDTFRGFKRKLKTHLQD